jgi:hypothetical protein
VGRADAVQWGARPNAYNAIFLDTAKHWGINGDDGHEEWSHHVLGTKWQIVCVSETCRS